MKDDLTIEEIVKYEGLCAVGFECGNCPEWDTCRPDKLKELDIAEGIIDEDDEFLFEEVDE